MKRRGANGLGKSGAMYGANDSQLMYNMMGIISNLKDDAIKSVHREPDDGKKEDKPGLITHLAVKRSIHKPCFILTPRKVGVGAEMGELQDSGVPEPTGLSSDVQTGGKTV